MQTTEQLIKRLRNDIDELSDALCEFWDIPRETCFFVMNDQTDVFCVNDDIFLNLADMVYVLEHGIGIQEVYCWQEYNTKASDFGFNLINLKSWHKGCPRVTDETFDRLQAMRDNLKDLVEIEKRRLKGE